MDKPVWETIKPLGPFPVYSNRKVSSPSQEKAAVCFLGRIRSSTFGTLETVDKSRGLNDCRHTKYRMRRLPRPLPALGPEKAGSQTLLFRQNIGRLFWWELRREDLKVGVSPANGPAR